MTRVALFLFNLPVLVKLFVILLLFYLYIIACIQFYTIFETHKIKKEEKVVTDFLELVKTEAETDYKYLNTFKWLSKK